MYILGWRNARCNVQPDDCYIFCRHAISSECGLHTHIHCPPAHTHTHTQITNRAYRKRATCARSSSLERLSALFEFNANSFACKSHGARMNYSCPLCSLFACADCVLRHRSWRKNDCSLDPVFGTPPPLPKSSQQVCPLLRGCFDWEG